jgi:hypothetical protein
VVVQGQEVGYRGAGSLDILVAGGDRLYTVEVQLGEVDTSHGFRLLDYWARNSRSAPDKSHVAVLVCESARGRYRFALEELAKRLPLIVIELSVTRDGEDLTITPSPVVASPELGVEAEQTTTVIEERTSDDWRRDASDEAWNALEALVRTAKEELGSVRADFTLSSYVGIRRGRNLWATVRPRKDGIAVNLPDPDGERGPHPSRAFEVFAKAVLRLGLILSWQPSFHGGTHPIALRLAADDFLESETRGLLKVSGEALDPEVDYFSDRWGGPSDMGTFRSTSDCEGDFDPYYEGEYVEAGYYPTTNLTQVTFYPARDEWEVLISAPELDWGNDECKREVARRVLIHHLERRPTARQIKMFLRGPAADWESGQPWTLEAGELAAWVWQLG